MARLWSSGAELNTTGSSVEFTALVGSPSIASTGQRSGSYALNNAGTGVTEAGGHFFQATADGHIFARVYIFINTLPSTLLDIVEINNGLTIRARIRMNTTGTLELWNASAQVGSDSAALNTGQWYRIEIEYDSTQAAGSDVLDARIDGVSFASSAAQTLGTINTVYCGNSVTSADFDILNDDIAINDSSGSFQNSWPGEGEIIHLRPNAAGDNAGWNDGTTDLYSSIDEVTPNDATDFIGSTDANAISDFNLDATPAALASDDTINCVQVGWRFNDSSSSFDHGVKLRIKASSSGTVEESAEQTIPDTTWRTNKIAAPFNYHLTLYDLPGASTTGWTKADLDTAQIGAENSTDQLGNAQISTMWLLVDHKPAAGGAATVTHLLGSTGVGG